MKIFDSVQVTWRGGEVTKGFPAFVQILLMSPLLLLAVMSGEARVKK